MQRVDRHGEAPPSDITAELSVLAGMMLDENCIADVSEEVSPSDFHYPSHQMIAGAIFELWDLNQPVDTLSVNARLEASSMLEAAGGKDAAIRICSTGYGAARAVHHAKRVRSLSVLRSIRNLAREALDRSYPGADVQELVEWFGREVLDLAEVRKSATSEKIGPIVERRAREILHECENRYTQGIGCGFPEIDLLLRGFQASRLYVIAARPGVGKTVAAWQMARAVASGGHRVLFFSLEMPKEELADRELMQSSGLMAEDVQQRSPLGARGRQQFERVVEEMEAMRIEIDDDSEVAISSIRSRCRREHRRDPLGLVVVDYLQLMRGEEKGQSREAAVAAMSGGLKRLAKELKIPIVALSQLNRQVASREDKRPRLSDLRESGAIEQDADVVILLNRPSLYDEEAPKNLATADVAKNRSGPTGEVSLIWDRDHMRFESR